MCSCSEAAVTRRARASRVRRRARLADACVALAIARHGHGRSSSGRRCSGGRRRCSAIVRCRRSSSYRLGRFDLGNMVQAVWSTTQGRLLEMTTARPVSRSVRLGSHVDPILALLAPLWMVWPSPLTLAAAQIVVGRARRAARLLARPPASRVGAARRACSRSRTSSIRGWRGRALDAIHPVTFAIPLLLFCRVVSRRGPARAVRGLRRARAVDRRAHGADDRRARRLVRARTRGGVEPGLVIAARRHRVDARRAARRRARRSPARRAPSTASTSASEDRRGDRSRRRSRIRARSSGSSSSPTSSSTS